MFRNTDLSTIAAEVKLGDPEVVASFADLLQTSRLDDDQAYIQEWAPLVSVMRAQEAAAIVASCTILYDMKADVLKQSVSGMPSDQGEMGRSGSNKKQPRWDSLVKEIGRHMVEQTNLQLAQRHIILHNRFVRMHNRLNQLWHTFQTAPTAELLGDNPPDEVRP